MVYVEPNLYTVGGTDSKYLMIPNLESFKQFCKYNNSNQAYCYMDFSFDNTDLVLIEFPAFFHLERPGGIGLKRWKKLSSLEKCIEQIDKEIEEHQIILQSLANFKVNIDLKF